MGVFRFKKFEVVNEKSAMKVNTDGVLLGALMTISPSDRRLLDIGTGTGTIALMAAQRLALMPEGPDARSGSHSPVISAIDIDEASATEAGANFRNSPWPDMLQAFHASLDGFAGTSEDCTYDLIFSNPPYFEDSLNAPEERRNNARHTSTGLSYREILDFAAERLSEDGRVSFVLPAETENALCRHARMNGLHLFRIVRVRTVPRKAPSRIIAEFSRVRTDSPEDTTLTIQDEGKYTQEYLSLMHDFYLFA
jgi:tRNA1Val (adenine37-N6)-methyltransferase